MRAIFEPHNVRTDRVPGEVDVAKDGLVFAYDKQTNAPTYFFVRGDERKPDTNRMILPDVPHLLGGKLEIAPRKLPKLTAWPDKRDFVIRDLVASGEAAIRDAREKVEKAQADTSMTPEKAKEA
jgi:hypothetical protein